MSLCDINVAIGAKAVYLTVVYVNPNKVAIFYCSTTNHLPHGSSMSQLSGDMFHVHLRLVGSL